MTHLELYDLPEANSRVYRMVDEEINGKMVRRVIPPETPMFVMLLKEGDPLAIQDADGRWWQIGWGPDRKRYRSEVYPPII